MQTVLIPVLTLEPSAFARQPHPTPSGTRAEDPRGWERHWRASLADAGIVGLSPVAPGSWLVAVTEFTDSSPLRILLEHALSGVDPSDTDEIAPPSGGYVLEHGEERLFPGCCGDLGNLEEWQKAAGHTSREWAMIWIGHPWVYVRAWGDRLQLSRTTEEGADDGHEVAVEIDRASLANAVVQAERDRVDFGARVEAALSETVPRVARPSIVDIMLRGHVCTAM